MLWLLSCCACCACLPASQRRACLCLSARQVHLCLGRPLSSRLRSPRHAVSTQPPCCACLAAAQNFLTLKAYDILVATEFGPTWGAPAAQAGGAPRSKM